MKKLHDAVQRIRVGFHFNYWLTSGLLVIILQLSSGNSPAAVLYDTMTTAAWSGSALGSSLSQPFTIPETELWSVESITLMLGQGDAASGTLTIWDGTKTTSYGTTLASSMQELYDFQPLQFVFSSPVSLTSGNYQVVENFNPADLPHTSFWDYNTAASAFMTRIEGTITPVPEPREFALLTGIGLLFLGLWHCYWLVRT